MAVLENDNDFLKEALTTILNRMTKMQQMVNVVKSVNTNPPSNGVDIGKVITTAEKNKSKQEFIRKVLANRNNVKKESQKSQEVLKIEELTKN